MARQAIITRLSRAVPLLAAGVLALAALASPVRAQDARVRAQLRVPDSLHVQIVTLRDETRLVGRFTSIDTAAGTGAFESTVGLLTIRLVDITEIQVVRNLKTKAGQFWLPNPNTTRLLFAPTGRMLKQGDGYFSVYQVLFPGLAVGVTDYVSLGGGMSLVPGVELAEQVYYLTPKVGLVQTEDVQAAVGALILNVPANGGETWNLLYGVLTGGREDSNITFGVGYGYQDGELSDQPVFMVGGIHRISPRGALISENYVPPNGEAPIVSLGLRVFGEKLSVDFGFFNVLSEDAFFPGLPFLGFVTNF